MAVRLLPGRAQSWAQSCLSGSWFWKEFVVSSQSPSSSPRLLSTAPLPLRPIHSWSPAGLNEVGSRVHYTALMCGPGLWAARHASRAVGSSGAVRLCAGQGVCGASGTRAGGPSHTNPSPSHRPHSSDNNHDPENTQQNQAAFVINSRSFPAASWS